MATWEEIKTSPKNYQQIVVLGIESYDCGWVYDTCYFENGEWKIAHLEKEVVAHMNYTHWLNDIKELKWKSIQYAPKNKVVLLGKKIGNEIIPCSAWWYDDLNCWCSTGVSGCEEVKDKFDLFAIPDDHNPS